jgi:RNA recognition motif-containing protein
LAADQSHIAPNRVIGVAISNPSKKTVHEVDGKQLYISNLPNSIVEADLEDFFKDCGKTQQIRLIRKQNGLGYAFVQFFEEESARKGLLLNGKLLDNHVLVISVADPNKRSADFKK